LLTINGCIEHIDSLGFPVNSHQRASLVNIAHALLRLHAAAVAAVPVLPAVGLRLHPEGCTKLLHVR
jgi:hypothetical protein